MSVTQSPMQCSKCLGRQRFAVADHDGATYVVKDGNGVGHFWHEVWCRDCGNDVPVGEPTTSACPGCTEECSACEGTGSVRCDSCGVYPAEGPVDDGGAPWMGCQRCGDIARAESELADMEGAA